MSVIKWLFEAQIHFGSKSILWRELKPFEVEVALVHRPKYDDWTFPKGKYEIGESAQLAAYRETKEETGIDYKGDLEVLYDDGQFCYYVAHNFAKEDVKLNYESSGYDWCSPKTLPLPLHPEIGRAHV